jgi:hypothetical protein
MRRLLLGLWVASLGVGCGPEPFREIINDPVGPPGSLRVTWSLARQDGGAATCDQVGVARVVVSAGTTASTTDDPAVETIGCGADQVFVANNLAPGVYPVSIVLLDEEDDDVDSFFTSVEVFSEREASVDHTFTLSGTGPSVGDLVVEWLVDGGPPEQQCVLVEATTVQAIALPGSIEQVEGEVDCTQGELAFEQVRIGDYELLLNLRDAAGETIASDVILAGVDPNQVTVEEANFVTLEVLSATVQAEWTVGGLSPTEGCALARAEEVDAALLQFDLREEDFVITETATASCEAGRVAFDGLIPAGIRQVQLDLVDTSLGRTIITSTIGTSEPLMPGMTTSVQIDIPVVIED